MSRLSAWMLCVLSACACHSAFAEEAWLLLSKTQHFAIVKTAGKEFHTLLDVGERPTWGESKQSIAVLSRKPALGASVLDLIDKTSEQLVSSHIVNGYVLSQLSGPSRDVVLTDEYAYFVTVRFTTGNTIELNEAGGAFDFNRLSLANDKQTTLPLPKNCINPRVIEMNGAPVVYAWKGDAAWKFNTSTGALEQSKMPLSYVEPESLGASWNLPKSALRASVLSASADSIYYVDWDTGNINKVTKAGTEPRWKLNQAHSELFDARVLLIKGSE